MPSRPSKSADLAKSAPAATSAPTPPMAPRPGPPTPARAFTPPRLALRPTDPAGLERMLDTEWLLTNALGGFAMGTAAGVPSRRYHALLIGATKPPVGRMAALNAFVETLVTSPGNKAEQRTDLCTFRFAGSPPTQHPQGVTHLIAFEKLDADLCRWTYRVTDDFEIIKELSLLDGQNAAQLRYTLRRLSSKHAARLHLRPLVSLRDMHALIRRDWGWTDQFSSTPISSGVRVSFPGVPSELHLIANAARFTIDPTWWYNFFYALDASRGQDCVEDLHSPGEFTLDLPAKSAEITTVIQASLGPLSLVDAPANRQRRTKRQATAYAAAVAGKTLTADDAATISALIAAADDFVVARASPTIGALDHTSIIAGYPWFADWGRDTSIALHGLLLATGRFDEARRTLLAFASHRHNGIVPNVFNDQTGQPEYNTVDASLWFILGCCAYFRATTDRTTWDGQLAPACLDIISAYRRGTDFNIAMDPLDKLITAGTAATQLTWMDARRDGVTFTPRHGKPVEINALWHAAIKDLSSCLRESDVTAAANLSDLADAIARSFRAKFWNERQNALFDVLTPCDDLNTPWLPDPSIRPNQIFAVSLPHSPLSIEQQRSILACVRDDLYTPFGLRTLSPADPHYQARYDGNLFQRDSAYHNGTAWPWLIGPYAEAILRTGSFSSQAKREARAALEPLINDMLLRGTHSGHGGCLGQIAEVYDGSAPQRAQGCTAQAWSVAEVLRVMLMVV